MPDNPLGLDDDQLGTFVILFDAARPLFEDATASDSIAPFEKQHEAHFGEALKAESEAVKKVQQARNQVTIKEGKSATDSNVYTTPTPADKQFAKDRLAEAEGNLAAVRENKEAVRAKLQRAQADGTAKAPGAIWSPRLEEFLSNTEVQSGLKKALKLEKQDAITERRPFKDSDYSIVGTDPAGDPIVGEVPTMKALAVAKEGLDARIAELKDPVTGRPTKAGLSLKRFRDEFLGELDNLNPRYKAARDAWSGPSQSAEAVNSGKEHFTRSDSNDQVKSEFDQLSPSDKEFYRMGAAEAKIDSVERAADAGDKSKKAINAERDRKRFRMLFDSDADADKFIEAVERKRTMFETKTAVKGGSQTAERVVEDGPDVLAAGLNLAHGAAHASSGNWLATLGSVLRVKRDLGLISDPQLNSEMARLLMDPSLQVSAGKRLLDSVPLPGVQSYLARGSRNALRLNGAASPLMRPPQTPNQ